MRHPLIVGVCCVLDRIQRDGITTNKQMTAACAVLDDPYQLTVVSALINISCVAERIDGPDFNVFPMLKGSPRPDRLLVRESATSPDRSQCLLTHVLVLPTNR